MSQDISAADPHPRRRVALQGTEMAYVELGRGRPILFLHGNPTSSYLWRNVLPLVADLGRCLAPDLVGMGGSGPAADGAYRFDDHARHLDAWIERMAPGERLVLVGHDWGSALAFDWARRHPERVRGLAYMEAIVRPLAWEDWPLNARGIFKAMRSSAGEELVLAKNVFIERILPSSVLRKLSETEMEAYRAPFREPGEKRRPMLTWPREIPIGGEPADMVARVAAYADWLAASPLPKLFINAEPGSILVGAQREFCRGFANQTEITVPGLHFVQEDSPQAIGQAVADFVRHLG